MSRADSSSPLPLFPASPLLPYLGVDAGGTHTRAVVVDGRGGRSAGQAGPANWTTLGPERCAGAVAEAIGGALAGAAVSPSALAGACIALAGYYPPWHEAEARAALGAVLPGVPLRLEPDLIAAWAGATGGSPGVVLVAGTGAVAYGRSADGSAARAGGWGPLFGDEGSGYWIGCEALRAVAHALDGRGPATSLTAVVSDEGSVVSSETWTSTDPGDHRPLLRSGAPLRAVPAAAPPLTTDPSSLATEQSLRAVYRDDWPGERIAALSVTVADHAAAGDRVAIRILERAGAALGALVATVAVRLSWGSRPLPVAPVGGVLEGGSLLRALLERWLAIMLPNVGWLTPAGSPVDGALLLAQEEGRPCPNR